jgi:UDP-N-acetylmuramate: L-alanyl-gamma-D-glutamyl-meso-diaminopimelate ligase
MGNRIPPTVKTIHLIAVCGTAMGALACMLKDLGYTVTGSDANVYPPMSTFLKKKGIRVDAGFDGARLQTRPDLVIVGNAVRKDNPEAVAMADLGLDYCSMPQALNHFVAAGRKAFVVTGTHGKTTTSSMLAWIFQSAGLDPSFMIGGILGNFNSNYRLGKGGIVVLEGDEYDTAFFDKGAKFYHFHPHVAVLTSVEFDHADIFTDLENVKRVFGRFVSGMDEDQALIAFDADPNIDALVAGAQCRLIRYGEKRTRTGVSEMFPLIRRGTGLRCLYAAGSPMAASGCASRAPITGSMPWRPLPRPTRPEFRCRPLPKRWNLLPASVGARRSAAWPGG